MMYSLCLRLFYFAHAALGRKVELKQPVPGPTAGERPWELASLSEPASKGGGGEKVVATAPVMKKNAARALCL